jgi:hypothetical protein
MAGGGDGSGPQGGGKIWGAISGKQGKFFLSPDVAKSRTGEPGNGRLSQIAGAMDFLN